MPELPPYPNPEPLGPEPSRWQKLRLVGSETVRHFLSGSGYISQAGVAINPYDRESLAGLIPPVQPMMPDTGARPSFGKAREQRVFDLALDLCEASLGRGGERYEMFASGLAPEAFHVRRRRIAKIVGAAWDYAETERTRE